MIESIKDAITDPTSDSLGWVHTAAEVVEAAEAVMTIIATGPAPAGIVKVIHAIEGVGGGYVWPITAGVAAMLAEFAAIGAGYHEAAKQIKRENAASGFSHGFAMGVMRETPDFIAEHFVRWNPLPNPAFELGGKLAQHYYNAGLALGFKNGRELDNDQIGVVFRDLAARGGPIEMDDTDAWSVRRWIDFYVDLGARFRKYHID